MDQQHSLCVIILLICACFSDIEASTSSNNITTQSTTSGNFDFGTTESDVIPEVKSNTSEKLTGFACVRQILIENPDMKQAEYLCICMGEEYCVSEEEIKKKYYEQAIGEVRAKNAGHVGVKAAMYILIFVTGLFGNLLVIVSVSKFMGRMTVTNIYILNLAVADLLVILICVPTKVYENVYMLWDLGDVACKLVLWMYFGSFMFSAFTLMCMALERYMVINHPMRSQMMSSVKRTLIIILFVWIAGVLCSLPTFFVSNVYEGFACGIGNPLDYDKRLAFYLYIFIAIFLVPSTLMAFAYIKTSMTLWKSIKKQQEMKHSTKDGTNAKSSDTSGRAQVIRVLIGVLIVFIVCWAPYLSVQVYLTRSHVHKYPDLKSVMQDVSRWFNFLSLANSCLNPILYGVLSRQFRNGFLRCLTCNKKGKDTAKSYITTTTSGGALTSRATGVTTTAHQMKTLEDKSEKGDKQENGKVIANGHVEENKTDQMKNGVVQDEVKANPV